MSDSKHPIPEGTISLSSAFTGYLRKMDPGWFESDPRSRASDETLRRLEQEFREAMSEGEIQAFIYDTAAAKRYLLEPSDWTGENYVPGFFEDFVGPFWTV